MERHIMWRFIVAELLLTLLFIGFKLLGIINLSWWIIVYTLFVYLTFTILGAIVCDIIQDTRGKK